MSVGILGLLVIVVVLGFMVSLTFASGRKRRGGSEGGGFSLGHATLNCPHCRKETRADHPECEHCGEDL